MYICSLISNCKALEAASLVIRFRHIPVLSDPRQPCTSACLRDTWCSVMEPFPSNFLPMLTEALSKTLFAGAQRYEEPTVLLAKRVTGEEEVPEGVVRGRHARRARRAEPRLRAQQRNMRVFFGICHEPEPLAAIEALAGKVLLTAQSDPAARLQGCPSHPHPPTAPAHITAGVAYSGAQPAILPEHSMRTCIQLLTALPEGGPSMSLHVAQAVYLETTAAGGVTWEEVEEAQLKEGGRGADSGKARKKLQISIPKWCGKWVVSMDEYRDGVVGAKSKNLAGAGSLHRTQHGHPQLLCALLVQQSGSLVSRQYACNGPLP